MICSLVEGGVVWGQCGVLREGVGVQCGVQRGVCFVVWGTVWVGAFSCAV